MVSSSEQGIQPLASEPAQKVHRERRQRCAAAAFRGTMRDRHPDELPHLMLVRPSERWRITAQEERENARRGSHTRIFFAFATLRSTEILELSALSTWRPRFVIR